jgi:hypothetical protein
MLRTVVKLCGFAGAIAEHGKRFVVPILPVA